MYFCQIRVLVTAVAGVLLIHVITTTTSPPSKDTYHSLFLSLASNSSAFLHLHTLTLRPHHASSPANSAVASYVTRVLSSASDVTSTSSYDVLLSFPVRRSLTLASSTAEAEDVVSFDLVQEIYPADPYADAAKEALPTFHAYSASGTVAGPAVYANYGRVEDFLRLREMGVEVNGSVVIARYVLLGNHNDAWTFGAVDPNSGTAALLELAERLGKLQKKGWRPRRSIVLCNWDAEEYGLIGSTEWVEENKQMLSSRAVAYLNVDSAVAGPGFHIDATPQLDELLKQAAKQVQDPDNSSQTLYESWVASSSSPLIGRLGGGSTDFAAFIQHVGVPSVDMFFGGGYPVYHSLYDDFVWMQKFGDPLFHRHVAVASIWGLIALRLADEEFLPFDYINYASELQKSAKILEDEILGMAVSFSPLYESITNLKKAASKIEDQKMMLEKKTWTSNWRKDPIRVRELNDRLMMAERAFTDPEGLFERPWYKHLIYGPSQHNDYGSKSFPGIDDAITKAKSLKTSESWRFVQHEVWRAARVVNQASRVLSGDLT